MPNSHIFDYLNYYINLPVAPNFAVMIDGTWGIGKTVGVKNYIEELRGNEKKVVYVSLYGLNSFEDIDRSILIGMYSFLNNNAAKYGGRVAKAALKIFGIEFDTDIKASDLMKISDIDMIIFDDLERCQLSPMEVLGYINTFVEHEAMKVLIIANEDEISEREKYNCVREKVVGMTFKMQPQTRHVLNCYIDEITDQEAKKFLIENRDNLLHLFQQSETNNLRILKQTILAWVRFFEVIDPELLKKNRGMIALFNLFIALSFETRAGRITSDDLTDRVTKVVAGMRGVRRDENFEATPLSKAQDRYAPLYLHDTVLTDDVLKQVLCDGKLNTDAINQSLSHSEHFIKPEDEPAWQKVWHGITRAEDEFEAAFSQMERQFAEREFIDSGEVLHVFSLRFWGGEIGHLSSTVDIVKSECIEYVDDLFESGRILEGSTHELERQPMTGAYGLAFYCRQTEEFRELLDYYITRLEEAKRSAWPSHVENLLELMSSDSEAFFAKICVTNDDRENTFALTPVLSTGNPQQFVDSFLTLHPSKQRLVFTALECRYEHNRLNNDLSSERDWLQQVLDLLLKKAEHLAPIRRYAIRNDILRVLQPLLQDDIN